MIKKSILAMFLLILSFNLTAIASDNNGGEAPEITFEGEEITDLNILYERAKKAHTNGYLDLLVKKNGELTFKDKGSNREYKKKIKTYVSSQLIKEKKHKNGTIERDYVVTAFADVTGEDLVSIASSGTGTVSYN